MTLPQFDTLDDDYREFIRADYDLDQQRCKCGRLRSECSDMSRDHEWFPGLILCRSQMETEAANRIWRERHEKEPFHDGTFQNWSAEFSEATPYRFDDGAQVIATPIDIGLGETFANPLGIQDDNEGGGPVGSPS